MPRKPIRNKRIGRPPRQQVPPATPKKEKTVKNKLSDKSPPANELAEGARNNIMVLVNLEPNAILAAPLGLITMGYSRNFVNLTHQEMYWAYLAYQQDLAAILSNNTSPISGRLDYLNGILASYLPKTVPFKTGTINYSWSNVSTIHPAPQFSLRNFNYYMYDIDGGTNAGGWLTQSPPTGPPSDQATYPVLAALYTLLAKNHPVKGYVPNIEFRPEYRKDVSAFASASPYFGEGNAPSSSAVASVESEVPFRSNILANLTTFTNNDGRVARNYNYSSLDSTFAHGYGILPEVQYNEYNTRFAPVAKFIDLDEVVYVLQYWYAGLVSQALAFISTQAVQSASEVVFSLEAFSFSPQQFRIMVRQCVAQMFSNTWALTQFINYSNAPNSFEPLRGGSNCYPGNLEKLPRIPEILNENLRQLMIKNYDVATKFHNDKNKLMYVPVWGVYTGAAPPNIQFACLDAEGNPTQSLLFTGSSANDPNIIDGNSTSGVCDLNASNYVPNLIMEWNERMKFLSQFSTTTAPMGGSAKGVLLSITRYAVYNTNNLEIDMSTLTKLMKARLPKEHIVKRKVQRTLSGKTTGIEEKEYYIPPAASLANQFTSAFSTLTVLNDSVKQMLSYFIYPSLVLEPNNVPTSMEYRTYTMECNILDTTLATNSIASTLSRLQTFATAMIMGLANNNGDELSAICTALNNQGKGGFLADIVGALAPLIPF